MNTRNPIPLTVSFAIALAAVASAQTFKGPSTASTPYIQPTAPGWESYSLLTVDNTGSTPDDVVTNPNGTLFSLNGIPDGMGAFDNGDGKFTLVVNHEHGNAAGVTRAHGSKGAYVSKIIINKSTLAVSEGEDLMKQIFRWNSATQSSNPTPQTVAFNRFCSGDLAAPTAYYNSVTGLGTTARIYMHGEEGGTGFQQATVASGPDIGKSYTLGKFNLNSNGSGINAVGSWENALACPYEQDKTVVLANNDGGSGIMTNAIAVYVGTKQDTGTEADKAGLTNGTLKFVSVVGNPVEIVNNSTRATNITSGTRFVLSPTSSTTFSRPEDGAWNPLNPSEYYVVTTDVLDLQSDGLGTSIGRTRLWRLTFDDITDPDLGGKIDLLIDGRVVGTEKVNMFDNITVNHASGHVLIQEDVGGAAHNGKIWEFDPVANTLVKIARHDPARFGDVGVPATTPFNNDEEGSGIIDITSIMADSALTCGNPREAWYISSDQTHYTNGITTAQVEGGQVLMLHDIAPTNNVTVTRGGFVRDRRTGKYVQEVTIKNETAKTMTGPFWLVLDNLSVTCTLANAGANTTGFTPLNSPCITVPVGAGSLAPGASATTTLQFTNPSNGAIDYTARTLNSINTP